MVKYSLRFAPEFLEDLNCATEYYDTKRVGPGKKFRSEVKSKLAIIKKSPHLYAIRHNDVRFALLEIFPYSIHFTIQQDLKQIWDYAILCQYRNPDEYWINFP